MLLSFFYVIKKQNDVLNDFVGLVCRCDLHFLKHLAASSYEIFQKIYIEVFEHILAEQTIEKYQDSVCRHIDSILLKFIRIQLQKVEQVEPLSINPQSKEAHGTSQRVIFNKADVIVPFVNFKIIIKKLKKLDDFP